MSAAMARPCTQKGVRATIPADVSNQPTGSEWRIAAINSTPSTIGVRLSVDQVSAPRLRRMASAFSSVLARKKIQVKQTKLNVARPPSNLAHQWGEGNLRHSFQAKTTPSANPCSTPQMRKFQEIPCQSPPSVKVIRKA